MIDNSIGVFPLSILIIELSCLLIRVDGVLGNVYFGMIELGTSNPQFFKACKNGDLEMYLLGFFDQMSFDQYKMILTLDFVENP